MEQLPHVEDLQHELWLLLLKLRQKYMVRKTIMPIIIIDVWPLLTTTVAISGAKNNKNDNNEM